MNSEEPLKKTKKTKRRNKNTAIKVDQENNLSVDTGPVSAEDYMNSVSNEDIKPKVGIVDDERCELHIQSPTHQESPDRVRIIRQKLKNVGLYDQLVKIEPIEPSKDDLLTVHTNTYINKVMRVCSNYKHSILSTDVHVSGEDSLISSVIAVGGVLAAVDTVLTTDVKKVFCNIRPPGHHASAHKASGFCIFNNVALGVKRALTHPKIKKVLIFDWDLHHGDGTQSIFKCNKNVMFSSFHREPPFYPGTGKASERGKYGTIYNFPQNNKPESRDYMDEFYKVFLPAAINFSPDIIFISCGFDGHKDDVYNGLPLTYQDFKIMTKELCLLANKLCEGRLISVLEGGYTLDVIDNCAAIHVKELINNN
jgi:acetoin utilization deacetylase AcuC-like enzyme